MLLFCCCKICFHLQSDTGFDSCNKGPVYGVYLWTAGREMLQNGTGWFWKMFTPSRQLLPNDSPAPQDRWTFSLMYFHAWHSGQPDDTSNDYACVSVLPERSYEWNDELCSNEYCFVCEDRNDK